ncbi:hypothetical protein K2173_023550 [Erythroxylum novogranatense]|uniref:MADS-box domain-containing protein n=1 Tax=Erythroxylum novogranatense TaxID=1862640 RepID=A0AAV8TQB9_9ROSI|nr:hypothetical protein K2173_023550 [Erythroxylum novogranatense]
MEGKKTKGKQKIEIKRIESESDRIITFSKRKSGIYKKASELVTLTGGEIAFGVLSPTGKPFTFAHPSIDVVANRLLGGNENQDEAMEAILEAYRQMQVNELTQELNQAMEHLDLMKQNFKELGEMVSHGYTKGWWSVITNELDYEKLEPVTAAFWKVDQELEKTLKERADGASSSNPCNISP